MKTPRAWMAPAVVVGYIVLVLLSCAMSGVDFTQVGDTVGNLVRGLLVPMVVFSVLLAALTAWLGWWRPVLRDDLRAPRWLWVVPALLVLGIAVGLATADRGARSFGFAVVALVATLFVGFNEEIVCRGLTVVGLRASQPEWRVFVFSSLLFGLMHGANIVLGQGVGTTVGQMALASAFGAVMYVVRRVSGTLILCMVLHGLWDWTLFVRVGAEGPQGALTTTAIGGVVPILLEVVALIVVIVAIFVGRGLFSGIQPAARVR